MTPIHEGGCICGSVHFRVRGNPFLVSVCHCTFCQRRTGTAFGMLSLFKAEDVEITGGPRTVYEHRSDENQRWIRPEFCSRCGTTVVVTLEKFPGAIAVSSGTLDDPKWLRINRHIWTRSALPWITYPPGTERFETVPAGQR